MESRPSSSLKETQEEIDDGRVTPTSECSESNSKTVLDRLETLHTLMLSNRGELHAEMNSQMIVLQAGISSQMGSLQNQSINQFL